MEEIENVCKESLAIKSQNMGPIDKTKKYNYFSCPHILCSEHSHLES